MNGRPGIIKQELNQIAQSDTVRVLGYGACALASTFWGMGFFFGKIAFSQFDVEHFVLYRFLFACAGVLPVMQAPRFSRHEWKLLGIASFFGIPVQFLLQFQGLKLTTASHAALMVGTMPVILAIGAGIFMQERLALKGWVALLCSSTGVALIVLSGTHNGMRGGNAQGDLLVVLSLLIALAWVLLNKYLMARGHSPLDVTSWGLLVGTAMLLVWVLLWEGPPPVRGIHLSVWLAVALSGVFSTAASTLLWNWGIHRVPSSRAGVFLNIEPALGSILGITLLGDHLGPGAWAGGILIIGAVLVLTRGDSTN